MTALLARPCPVCSAAYAEHTLDDLAGCMESALGTEPTLDEGQRTLEDLAREVISVRPILELLRCGE